MTLGRIVQGSLREGFRALLERGEIIEDYSVGSLIMIRGIRRRYLGIISNVGINSNLDSVGSIILSNADRGIRDLAIETLRDRLSSQWIDIVVVAQEDVSGSKPADTAPSFYSPVIMPRSEDLGVFFQEENMREFWGIGEPKVVGEVKFKIPVDISKLVELSFGIFGKSGTGKTFLGNMLAGFMLLYDLALSSDEEHKPIRLLIFDMHSEYALDLLDNLNRPIAEGVAQIFSNMFRRFTPDPDLARERNLELLKLDLSEFTIDDLIMIAPIFGLTQAFLQHLYDFQKILSEEIGLGEYWMWGLLLDDATIRQLEKTEEGAEILNKLREITQVEPQRLVERIRKRIGNKGHSALQSFITQASKLKAILKYPLTIGKTSIDEIVNNLVSKEGKSVVISFGRFEKETPLYMLIANLIARKLRNKILEKSKKGEETETKIVIFLEEAHNFLGKTTYRLSPFGDIAREMRKKGVTLCVIDQKPAELDRDVISMLWTNFVFTLTDKNDIEAALMGIENKQYQKIVPTLNKREVLVFGEAINFPVVIQVRDYKEVAEIFKQKAREMEQELNQIVTAITE